MESFLCFHLGKCISCINSHETNNKFKVSDFTIGFMFVKTFRGKKLQAFVVGEENSVLLILLFPVIVAPRDLEIFGDLEIFSQE